MYQAGIKNITLYENKGISFVYYDSGNSNAVTNIANSGAIVQILNVQQPEFESKTLIGNSGNLLNEYTTKFLILGYERENLETIAQIITSIYGWLAVVEYYDGTFKFYNTPLKSKEGEIKPQAEMSFAIELTTPTPSLVNYLDYNPTASTTPIYRCDTTLITCDTTIYTCDYAL